MINKTKRKSMHPIEWGEPDEFGNRKVYIPKEFYARCRLCGITWMNFKKKGLYCPNCGNDSRSKLVIGNEEERW